MICPQCKAEGKTSTVNGGDHCCRTAMGYQSYFDEQGKRHTHDPNTSTYSYVCSNGHEWTEKHYGKCWCGWTRDPNAKTQDAAEEEKMIQQEIDPFFPPLASSPVKLRMQLFVGYNATEDDLKVRSCVLFDPETGAITGYASKEDEIGGVISSAKSDILVRPNEKCWICTHGPALVRTAPPTEGEST